MIQSISQFRERLNRQLGERVFLEAQKDLIEEKITRNRAVPTAARVLSFVVLLSPFFSILVGALSIYLTFPNLVIGIVGVALIGLGYLLLPKRQKAGDNLLTRDELPATFRLLDQITERMKTETITSFQVTPDFNAFMLHAQDKRVLGIGAILWRAITPEERLAVIAHEVAHQVNGDPARHGLTSKALFTLEGWLWFLEPDADEFLTEILMYIPFLVASGMYKLLLRLVFLESQRAEYLADALAANVAGASALKSVLRKLTLVERIEKERLGMHANSIPGGLTLVDRFARAITETPEQERNEILSKARAVGLSVDGTHPPTHYRIAFLDLLTEEAVAIISVDQIERSNAELMEHFEKQGDILQREIQKDEEW